MAIGKYIERPTPSQIMFTETVSTRIPKCARCRNHGIDCELKGNYNLSLQKCCWKRVNNFFLYQQNALLLCFKCYLNTPKDSESGERIEPQRNSSGSKSFSFSVQRFDAIDRKDMKKKIPEKRISPSPETTGHWKLFLRGRGSRNPFKKKPDILRIFLKNHHQNVGNWINKYTRSVEATWDTMLRSRFCLMWSVASYSFHAWEKNDFTII